MYILFFPSYNIHFEMIYFSPYTLYISIIYLQIAYIPHIHEVVYIISIYKKMVHNSYVH